MKSNGSIMSTTQVQSAMLSISEGIFATSLSEKNCLTLKESVKSCTEENASDEKTTADSFNTGTKPMENMLGKLLRKRRHSATPAPLPKDSSTRPRPRHTKSLTEIEVNTEIIDGLFTTTLCSTEL